jgi:hypothetical protein
MSQRLAAGMYVPKSGGEVISLDGQGRSINFIMRVEVNHRGTPVNQPSSSKVSHLLMIQDDNHCKRHQRCIEEQQADDRFGVVVEVLESRRRSPRPVDEIIERIMSHTINYNRILGKKYE